MTPSEQTSHKAKAVALAEAARFLEAVLRPTTPDSHLEIRPMRGGETVDRAWHRVGDLRQSGFETALPYRLDGVANVYYGICPRIGKGGTKNDVSQATSIWFDEITKPAPDLPPLSWMVETSPGKVQGGYFLKDASRNLDRVERLSRRLGAYVGGDNVWNRDRILRMPGFINAKYPDGPRSFLLEFHPDLRYSLEELERLIPELPPEIDGDNAPTRQHDRPFDPHAGNPLPPEVQEQLGNLIRQLGLRRHYDGRYVGACPLPHDNGPSDGSSAFYISPATGAWHCFGSSHQRQRHGGASALIPGIDDVGWTDDISRWVGYDANSEPFYSEPPQAPQNLDKTPNVPDRVIGFPGYNSIRDISRLWVEARTHFPLSGSPWLKGSLLANRDTGEPLWVNMVGRTWRFLPNAQHHRACIYVNLTRRIGGRQLYALRLPADDASAAGHERLRKRLSRALQKVGDPKLGWCWIDNAVSRGYVLYLTTAPNVRGFEPVEGTQAALVDVLKSISPPSVGEPGRFRPYDGSDNWTARLDSTGEEDRDRWEVLAVADKPTDFTQVEAECVASGTAYEFTREYWRSQVGRGLRTRMAKEEAVELAVTMGYRLTKYGRAVAGLAVPEALRVAAAPLGEYPPPPAADNSVVEVVI